MARRRGGDPVTRMARAATAGGPDLKAILPSECGPCPDSVGLSSADRQRNVAGRVKLCKPVSGETLVIDDIVTTGATARESVRTLLTVGVRVVVVLTVANA